MGADFIAILLTVSAATFQVPPDVPADITVRGMRLDPDQVVCEKFIPAGSRVVTRKVCATQRDWDERRRADREAVDDVVRQNLHINARPD